MVLTLLVSSIPMNELGWTSPLFTPSPNSEQTSQVEEEEEKEKRLPDPHPIQIKKQRENVQENPTEVVEEKMETEKVFNNNDSTFTKKVCTEPIHTEKDGKLEEFSPDLVEAPNEKIVTENI